MSKIIKPNCQKCYYTACFIPKSGLASCKCERITEPVIIELDKLMNKERRYVKRNKWDDECDCDCFIPDLSEAEQDFELEEVCTFETCFDCPFCGEEIYVDDIGFEETKLIECENCGKQIAVGGKSL